jgi:hypothetical protein
MYYATDARTALANSAVNEAYESNAPCKNNVEVVGDGHAQYAFEDVLEAKKCPFPANA